MRARRFERVLAPSLPAVWRSRVPSEQPLVLGRVVHALAVGEDARDRRARVGWITAHAHEVRSLPDLEPADAIGDARRRRPPDRETAPGPDGRSVGAGPQGDSRLAEQFL